MEETVKYVYDQLHNREKAAVIQASGYIAIINANLEQTPDFVFTLIQEKFPNITRRICYGYTQPAKCCDAFDR
jgi:hypothetical protein